MKVEGWYLGISLLLQTLSYRPGNRRERARNYGSETPTSVSSIVRL